MSSRFARRQIPVLSLVLGVFSGGTVLAQDALNAGDITVSATSMASQPCPECPGGTGTKLCYELTYASNAEQNTDIDDFHVAVNDANANNFQCFTAAEGATPQAWSTAHASQQEGNVNKHYISWFDNGNPGDFSKGETWTFCVVYCGATTNRDDTVEYIVTEDGTNLPAVPDANGNRADVPNDPSGAGNTDDAGWKGTKNAPGSGAGFVLGACCGGGLGGGCIDSVAQNECTSSEWTWQAGLDCGNACIPTLSEWGLAAMGLMLLGAATIVVRRQMA